MMRTFVAAAALAGCYRPTVASCQYACAPQGTPCPTGLQCVNNACVHPGDTCGGDAGRDTPVITDVPPTSCALFGTPTVYATQANPRAVAIGNLDTDALPDIAVATIGSISFDTLFGTGGGAFSTAYKLPVIGPTQSIAVMPSNVGLQVAVTEAAGGVDNASTYKWVSTTYQQFGGNTTSAGGAPGPLVVGNFDSDGYADLVVANTLSNDLWVFEGESTGQQGLLVQLMGLAAPSTAIAAADIDLDGHEDLVLGNSSSAYQVALKNVGDASFTLGPAVLTSGNPSALALVDLDGDRYPDLVIVDDSLQIAFGKGDGTFGPLATYTIDPAAHGVALGDFDRDGIVDLAITSSGTDSVTVFEGLGNGSFKSPVNVPLLDGAQVWGIAAGDLDGDDHDDLVVTYSSKAQVAVLLDTCMP
jgi:hypothetical protein